MEGLTKVVESPLNVLLDCGELEAEHVRSFSLGPSCALDQQDDRSLTLRQRGEGFSQARLRINLLRHRTFEDGPQLVSPAPTLANPVEEGDWALERLDTVPVLPCPCQSLGCCLASAFSSVVGNQGVPKPGFDLTDEPCEVLAVVPAVLQPSPSFRRPLLPYSYLL